jgi:FkbM family methyltransferase
LDLRNDRIGMKTEVLLLKSLATTLYLDVGANVGQTGRRLRKSGFKGRIASFEPLLQCFTQLEAAAQDDPLWQTFHMALGNRNERTSIGVSRNLQSSSILPVTDHYVQLYYRNAYTHREETAVERLDAILPGLARPHDVIHLKLDTQGFERFVIDGASGVLDRIYSVQMEVAVAPMYEGEMVMHEAIALMHAEGYLMIDTTPAFCDPRSGEATHFDLLFRRGGLDHRLTAPPLDQSLKARFKRWNRARIQRRREGRA